VIRRASILVVAVWLWFSAAVVEAQAVYTHAVQEGDTFASIAQRYYGDPTREAVLREANRMKDIQEDELIPGSWLFVPTVAFVRVEEGETWRSLAARFYGNGSRSAVLIDANKGNRRVQPDEGAELLVPYPLRHVVAPGETLAKIAAMYLPSTSTSLKRLRQFNAGARIERGRVVLVPLSDLRLAGDGRMEAAEAFARAAGGGAAKEAQDEVETVIPELIRQVEEARFAEAVALGNRLLGAASLTSTQAVTIQKELGVAYVALERRDLGEAAFRAALALQPNLELDTVRTSPRVLEAFNRAKQPVAP
jgi:LysM repeat protein